MENVTYKEIVKRYGQTMAYDLLVTLEKSSKARQHDIHLDEETRWERALQAMSIESKVA